MGVNFSVFNLHGYTVCKRNYYNKWKYVSELKQCYLWWLNYSHRIVNGRLLFLFFKSHIFSVFPWKNRISRFFTGPLQFEIIVKDFYMTEGSLTLFTYVEKKKRKWEKIKKIAEICIGLKFIWKQVVSSMIFLKQ